MLLILLAAAAAQSAQPGPAAPPAPLCNPTLARTAVLSPSEARKLGELPPGILQKAVLKTVNGCAVTVLPIRDANGDHVMMFNGQRLAVQPARRSGVQARPKR